MPDLDLGEVTIHYEESGSGPLAYVFCHGLGSSGADFLGDMPFWAKHFPRVIAWDNRGMGKSSRAKKYSLPLYASDPAGLLKKLGVRKAALHGISWGGVVVQQFALDHPEMCAALIIDSSSSETSVSASEGWYQRGEQVRLGATPQSDPRRASGGPSNTAAGGPSERDPGRLGPPALTLSVKPEHVESYVACARAVAGLREHPLTPRLKAIKCPVLVIAGGEDKVAGVGGSVILARNLPDARLEIVPGAGHGVFRENPEQFRALVLQFCRERGIIGN